MTFISNRPYTAADEQTARSMLVNGSAVSAIARKLRRSDTSITALLLRLEKRERLAKLQVRPCLSCRTDFKSEGAHNRLCCRCRTRETTPFDL